MTPRAFAKCLVDAGLLTQEEANRTSRVVIDCSMDAPVTIYVQRYGDADALAKLAPMLNGMVRAGSETAQAEPREGTAP
jgi:hypothetical protein